jgi:NCAIR mutase (PurE)-related protein
MFNSCASGVTVVNIYPKQFGVNNGFGAGYAASLINQLAR